MQPEPSRQVLESTPARVLTFLRAIGTNTEIRSTLASVGYSAEEHQQAWTLLHKASGYAEPAPPSGDDAVRKAIAELTAWDEPGFRRIRAALARLHPAQASFVFEALAPAEGAASILAVRKLLDRLSALEAGEGPGSPAENQAAVATLEKRGITKTERKRLAGLLALAEKAPEPVPPPPPDSRLDDLKALRAWYADWSETARAVITRRDHLIRLGLARRRRPAAASPEADEASDADVDDVIG